MPLIENILLVYPTHHRFVSNASTFRLNWLATPHTGLTIIGQILEDMGHSVRVVDERLTSVRSEDLDWADLVGISIQTLTAIQGYKLARRVEMLGKVAVLGGVHATLNPEEALAYCRYVVRNEGEEALPELIDQLNAPRTDLSGILGLSYRAGHEAAHNPARPFIEDLDRLPPPDLFRVRGMGRTLSSVGNHFVHFTYLTRGCPYRCNFCSITETFGRRLRRRSPKSLVEELKDAWRGAPGLLFFYDDNLMGDLDYAKAVLEEMLAQECIPTGWHSQMRQDVAKDPELLDLMAKTNCIVATFGFESINPRTLKFLEKGQTVADIEHCVRALHERHIAVNGFFVLGADDDDTGTIDATVQFALSNDLELAAFMPLTPFPGTRLHAALDAEGRIFSRNWELYDVQHVVYYPRRMTPTELYTGLLRAYQRFYSLRHLRRLRPRQLPGAIAPHWTLLPFMWSLRTQHNIRRELRENRDYLEMLQRLPDHPTPDVSAEMLDLDPLILRAGPLALSVDRVAEINS